MLRTEKYPAKRVCVSWICQLYLINKDDDEYKMDANEYKMDANRAKQSMKTRRCTDIYQWQKRCITTPNIRTLARAAVGMGIPMGIPMGMGMVWVWGL